MASKRTKSKGKQINPHYWVFCEGETEEAYVCLLRAHYRLPIEVVTKVFGTSITARCIKSHKVGKPTTSKDKDFLLYDADRPDVIDRLQKIKDTVLLASNPSIELWFLFHYKNVSAEITSAKCIKEISNRIGKEYRKGFIDPKLERKLKENYPSAIEYSKKTIVFNNPSSNVYILLEELEKVKKSLQ